MNEVGAHNIDGKLVDGRHRPRLVALGARLFCEMRAAPSD